MLTQQERATINRTNAQKSTGPKTAEGKANSRKNAIKDGQYAETLKAFVPPHSACHANEDRQAFYQLLDIYIAKYQPTDDAEFMIVREIADCQWSIRRNEDIESTIHNFEMMKLIPTIDDSQPELANLRLQVALARNLAKDETILAAQKRTAKLRIEISRLERRYFQMKKHCPSSNPAVRDSNDDRIANHMETKKPSVARAKNEPKFRVVPRPIHPFRPSETGLPDAA